MTCSSTGMRMFHREITQPPFFSRANDTSPPAPAFSCSFEMLTYRYSSRCSSAVRLSTHSVPLISGSCLALRRRARTRHRRRSAASCRSRDGSSGLRRTRSTARRRCSARSRSIELSFGDGDEARAMRAVGRDGAPRLRDVGGRRPCELLNDTPAVGVERAIVRGGRRADRPDARRSVAPPRTPYAPARARRRSRPRLESLVTRHELRSTTRTVSSASCAPESVNALFDLAAEQRDHGIGSRRTVPDAHRAQSIRPCPRRRDAELTALVTERARNDARRAVEHEDDDARDRLVGPVGDDAANRLRTAPRPRRRAARRQP